MKVQCPICSYLTATPASFKHHIKGKHKELSLIDVEQLYIKHILNLDIDFDIIISDYLQGLCFDDITKKYNIPRNTIENILKLKGVTKRTQSESKTTKQYTDKYTKTIKDKYNVENISQLNDVKEKKKITSLQNNGYINNFCNKEIRDKGLANINYQLVHENSIKTMIERYGVENPAQIPEVKEKLSILGIKRNKNLTYEQRLLSTQKARESITYTSKLELRIQAILNDLQIEYTVNMFIGNYNFDIVFKNKVILEIQGDYWHANPNIYKSEDILIGKTTAQMIWDKDNRKKIFVSNKGYILYCLWEIDINKMTNEEIINFLKTILI